MIVATKTVLYFSDELPFEVLLAEMPALSQSVFDSHWQKMEGKDGRFAVSTNRGAPPFRAVLIQPPSAAFLCAYCFVALS